MSVFALDKIGLGGKGTVQTADELNCLANEMREYLGTPTGEEETSESLTIIADESAIKSVRQDFTSACLLEGYLNMGVLELYGSSRVTSTVLYNGKKARSIVGGPSNYVSMDSESESRVSNIQSYISSVSEESSKSHLKTGGIS